MIRSRSATRPYRAGRAVGRPRVAIGVPVFNRAEYLEEALESLLLQSYQEFALVVSDDCSTDATPELVRRYAARDPRVHYERNARRLGMVANWRRAYSLARRHAPGFEYFAFASDHDVWHPDWLEALVCELDADPDVVLAYPVTVPIRPDGSRKRSSMTARRWDTAGVADAEARVREVAGGIPVRAGNIVYGLFRARALERCGVLPFAVGPDRLLMAELAMLGTFKQVPRELWMRRFWEGEQQPQRRRLFGPRPPLHSLAPTGVVHTALLFRWAVLAGAARPEVGRARAAGLVGVYARGLFRSSRALRKTRNARRGRAGRHDRLDSPATGKRSTIRRPWRRAN